MLGYIFEPVTAITLIGLRQAISRIPIGVLLTVVSCLHRILFVMARF